MFFYLEFRERVSERGQTVGQALQFAFVWSPQKGLRSLPTAATGPTVVSAAFAANSSGEAVGFEADFTSGIDSYPVRWTRGDNPITLPRCQEERLSLSTPAAWPSGDILLTRHGARLSRHVPVT